MTIIETHKLRPGESHPAEAQIYNALDTCLTFEVFEELTKLRNELPALYDFSRAMQGPALEMMLRGWRIDQYERRKGAEALRIELTGLINLLNVLAEAVWDNGLNARSPQQLKKFFYSHMRLPEVWLSQKGERKLSTNREALEKLEAYLHARPIVATILAVREVAKRLEVLETEVDSDDRMRTSYNIAGTETTRWSSSANAFGTGGNLQNITPSLRRMFVADCGWKLCGIDLEQAESREVGWLLGILFSDWKYLDACEGGDLHTTTASLIWPQIRDRKAAEASFYRHFSHRDMSKRGGHLSNYMGTAWTASRSLKVPLGIMEDFQQKYCLGENAAFPSIPKWWRHIAQELQTTQRITNNFGVTRQFFGRPDDDATLREAIAFGPQSSTALRLNLALWRIWHHMRGRAQILGQVHDALYFQFAEDDNEDDVVQTAMGLMSTKITDARSGRVFDVPGEAKVGWNWASTDSGVDKSKWIFPDGNPDGMKKWKLGARDARTRSGNGKERIL